MDGQVIGRMITTLTSNLSFSFYPPLSTDEVLVLRRSDDKMFVWVEKEGVYIGKTYEGRIPLDTSYWRDAPGVQYDAPTPEEVS